MKQTLLTRNELYKNLIELDEETLVQKFITISKKYNYPIFKSNNKYPINLNIWGIRSNNEHTDYFNDVIAVFYNTTDNKWICNIYEATTDPSAKNLMNPVNKKGCAVLIPDYYPKLWKLGYHKGSYKALVQASPCNIYRDNNMDDIINYGDELKIDRGVFGINLHRASIKQTTDQIGLYSAGCQVIKNANEFKDIIELCEKAIGTGYQSYVLINEDLLKL